MRCKSCAGNAFFITLVSVLLLGALTFVVVRQMNGSGAPSLNTERADLYASQLIAEATSMKSALDQMQQLGIKIEDINFDRPEDASFNSGTVTKKIFHPAGGGKNNPSTIPPAYVKTGYASSTRWTFQLGRNVGWTPTSATDILYSIAGINDEICSALNKRITGSSTIPTYEFSVGNIFIYGGTDTDFTASDCAACNGYPMLCLQKTSTGTNVFYAVVAAR